MYLSRAGTPSFPALIAHRFSDAIADRTAKALRAKRILPERMFLKKIRATGSDPHDLTYDVLFLCLYTENGRKKRGDFTVSCACSLDDAFMSTRIFSVSPLKEPYRSGESLPDDLVPNLSGDALDRAAEQILSEYCPEALTGAPVDAVKLAERIGLRVETAGSDDDLGNYGQVFFENSSDATEDPETGILKLCSVSSGTVLVRAVSKDPATDRAIRNNTVLHECVHWLLHRPAFLLYEIFDPSSRSPVTASAVQRMERQANALSPRLLLPAGPVRSRTGKLLTRYVSLSKEKRASAVIRNLCAYYGASRQLTEIRLSELGYGDLLPSRAARNTKRYEIGIMDAVNEFLRSTAFQKALRSGRYRYADNCFVLRDERFSYLTEDGSASLTDHAKRHRERCCLPFVFKRAIPSGSTGMHRRAASEPVFLSGPLPDTKALAESAAAVSRILRSLPSGFPDTLVAHMKRKHVTSEALSEASSVSVRQLARLRNGQYREIPLPTAVALCIGLKLHPILSFDLIEKAGIRLTGSIEHAGYQILLLCMADRSIYECDRFLNELGIPPLEKKERLA